MPNENCLAGIVCPKCGSEEPFYIVCTANYIVYDEGTDYYDNDGIEWDENSPCSCHECNYRATVGDFMINDKTEKEKE